MPYQSCVRGRPKVRFHGPERAMTALRASFGFGGTPDGLEALFLLRKGRSAEVVTVHSAEGG
jgi:hypothetical protein